MQLNLKFEIEVLCKNLALDINELKPGSLLKDKDRLKNLDEQLSAPKKDVKQPEELPPITTTSEYASCRIQNHAVAVPIRQVVLSQKKTWSYRNIAECLGALG